MSFISIKSFVEAFGGVDFLLNEGGVTFSQNGEDIAICGLLRGEQQKGVFVDLGAYHPIRYSNTFLLYLAGWRGVNVDANPEVIEQCQTVRPEDTSITALVSDRSEQLEYYRFQEGAYNTANRPSIELLTQRSHPDNQVLGVENLSATAINELLSKYVGDRKFDFLNIDIEGLDEKVLLGMDFSRFRPKVIAMETGLSAWISGGVGLLLRDNGYEIHSYCGHTLIVARID